jgi:hypothetical protein
VSCASCGPPSPRLCRNTVARTALRGFGASSSDPDPTSSPGALVILPYLLCQLLEQLSRTRAEKESLEEQLAAAPSPPSPPADLSAARGSEREAERAGVGVGVAAPVLAAEGDGVDGFKPREGLNAPAEEKPRVESVPENENEQRRELEARLAESVEQGNNGGFVCPRLPLLRLRSGLCASLSLSLCLRGWGEPSSLCKMCNYMQGLGITLITLKTLIRFVGACGGRGAAR